MSTVRYEFTQGTSSKFWEATPRPENDGTWTAWHGRIGGTPIFSGILTQKEVDAKLREKKRKGYVLTLGVHA